MQSAHGFINASLSEAKKLPDIGIQLWATALLKDVANLRGNAEEERRWFADHDRFSKAVIDDHVKAMAAPEHWLIEVGGTFSSLSKFFYYTFFYYTCQRVVLLCFWVLIASRVEAYEY